MEHVDWKQLGYLITDITDNENDQFTSILINEGILLVFCCQIFPLDSIPLSLLMQGCIVKKLRRLV